MNDEQGWSRIEAEARLAFAAGRTFPLPAYSERMPPPYVGIKPCDPARADAPATAMAGGETSLDVTEYEQAQELEPGLARIADHLVAELRKLVRGEAHALSRTLLADNPAWPEPLAEAARQGRLAGDPIAIALPLALSRTQDDKGNVRWTLFGASHHGASAPFWRSFAAGDHDGASAPSWKSFAAGDHDRASAPSWKSFGHDGGGARHTAPIGPQRADRDRFARFVAWAARAPEPSLGAVRILAGASEVPACLRDLLLADEPHPSLDGVRTLVTFRPFASLPDAVQRAYLAGELILVPSPASLVFFEHPSYRELARELPHATQIPLLHLFPRCEGGYAIRIPQSGWIEERNPGQPSLHGHRIVSHVVRTHRYERVPRDGTLGGDGAFTSKVSVALFSTNPDDLGLYGKPMARNAQLWRETYELLLDGPEATRRELDHAAQTVDAGGRFGYRFLYPAMRAGTRELYWHLPLLARLDPTTGRAERFRSQAPLGHTGAEPLGGDPEAPLGYVSAEPVSGDPEAPRITLAPRLLRRSGHHEAATLFARDAGHARLTTTHNARKLLDLHELLGRRLPPSFARQLLHVGRGTTLEQWLSHLPDAASDRAAGERLVAALRGAIGAPSDTGPPLTFDRTATRAFEESVWRTIAALAEGGLRQKENADTILVNDGKSGGSAGRAAHVERAEGRDLERAGDLLHALHRELVARHGMEGRALVVDHVFRWETECDLSWSEGWSKNQTGEACERNVVLVIPGRNRGEAIVMGDHYDTAYMEDVYDADRGGDGLRAAASGADDNGSATSALLHAADVLLPLARDGKLARDVWLVHLTGEEFPADCLGARALAQALVERRLAFTTEGGERLDVSHVRVAGAFVLDMIGHNSGRDRDVFQIAPGEGAASARLALAAHLAGERWNRGVAAWTRVPERRGTGRAQRMPDGSEAPPPFAHLALSGEIRAEWEPRSALYNTDGQIFSDVGVPVVLFMENYDIARSGYHDTQDTMKNIDLDYAAAMTAIAIETVAACACAAEV